MDRGCGGSHCSLLHFGIVFNKFDSCANNLILGDPPDPMDQCDLCNPLSILALPSTLVAVFILGILLAIFGLLHERTSNQLRTLDSAADSDVVNDQVMMDVTYYGNNVMSSPIDTLIVFTQSSSSCKNNDWDKMQMLNKITCEIAMLKCKNDALVDAFPLV
jgi:hypothetical protein